MSYILVTPCKNEEKSLLDLIFSVKNQTIKPTLWLIIDDGSTDNSPQIINRAKKENSWITSFRLKEGKRDIGIKYAYVCKTGFDYVIKFCKEHKIKYHYIGLVDADMVLDKDFFEKLMAEFEKNPKLGIASGGVYNNCKGNFVWESSREDLPRGGARLWRKDCFEETNGYQCTSSPDVVSNVKAMLRGWEIRQFKEIKAIQSRPTSSAEGLWKGYYKRGFFYYYLNYNPIIAFSKGLTYCFRKPYYIGLFFLYGYFRGLLKRQAKIKDKEIRAYFYEDIIRDIWQYYWNNFKNKLI